MKEEVVSLIERYSKLQNDTCNYITSTEHWILYWIENKEVQDFIKEYPDNFEDLVSLSVINLMGESVYCKIKFEDHPNNIEYINRYCMIYTFRDIVRAKYMQTNDGIKEYKIKVLKNELEYFKKKVSEYELKIKEMEK